jgi:hypothetical protein
MTLLNVACTGDVTVTPVVPAAGEVLVTVGAPLSAVYVAM